MLPTKFWIIWQSSFREEDFQKSTNLIQELPVAAMFVNGSKRNEQSIQRTFHRCFLPNFISFGPAVSEERLFQKSTNKKQKLPMTAMFVNDGSKRNEQFPQMLPTTFQSIWPSCFRVEDFQKSTNQKQELPVVAMFVNGSGRNEHSLQRTAHRCFLPSFGSFGQAVSEQKNLKNQPIRNKSRLWWPCLLMDRDEMSNLYRGPAFHRCFLPSFGFRGEDLKKISNICRDNCILKL